MRFLIQTVLITALAFVLELFIPWWPIVIAPFVVSMLMNWSRKERKFSTRKKKRSLSFLAGFIAIFLLWGIYAFMIDSGNDHLLSGQIQGIIAKSTQNTPFFFAGLTALIGGLAGGMCAMTGGLFGSAIKSR